MRNTRSRPGPKRKPTLKRKRRVKGGKGADFGKEEFSEISLKLKEAMDSGIDEKSKLAFEKLHKYTEESIELNAYSWDDLSEYLQEVFTLRDKIGYARRESSPENSEKVQRFAEDLIPHVRLIEDQILKEIKGLIRQYLDTIIDTLNQIDSRLLEVPQHNAPSDAKRYLQYFNEFRVRAKTLRSSYRGNDLQKFSRLIKRSSKWFERETDRSQAQVRFTREEIVYIESIFKILCLKTQSIETLVLRHDSIESGRLHM